MTTRILITNDDGIRAPGLEAMAQALEALGEVWVVAPEQEMSATSHAVTLHKPLRVKRLGDRRFIVSGTPTDCVFLGLGALVPERPALLVSGINRGGNVAADVSYSGTVGAAMEGALRGVPSMAISRNSFKDGDYTAAAEVGLAVARRILEHGLAPLALLNVNVPALPRKKILGVKVTTVGQRSYGDEIVRRTDPRGREYCWIGGTDIHDEPIEGTDNHELLAGYATVTPMTMDFTAHGLLPKLRGWELQPW